MFLTQHFLRLQNNLDWRNIPCSAKQNKNPKRKQEDNIETLNLLQYSLRKGTQKMSVCKEEAQGGRKNRWKSVLGVNGNKTRTVSFTATEVNNCNIISTVHDAWRSSEMMPCFPWKSEKVFNLGLCWGWGFFCFFLIWKVPKALSSLFLCLYHLAAYQRSAFPQPKLTKYSSKNFSPRVLKCSFWRLVM